MQHAAVGALTGGVVCLAASPYLAGLARTVPDKTDDRWWRPTRVPHPELARAALVAVVLGALAGAAAGTSAVLPALLVLALLGTPLVLIDVRHHRLPYRLTYPLAAVAGVLLAVAAAVTHGWPQLLRALGAAATVLAVLALLRRAGPRNSFGRGDVHLGGVVGGYLGWFGWPEVGYGVFAGFLLGAFVSLALVAARRATLKTHIPFGPMLLLGALIVLAFDLVPTDAV